jgi:hypothetical protein
MEGGSRQNSCLTKNIHGATVTEFGEFLFVFPDQALGAQFSAVCPFYLQ